MKGPKKKKKIKISTKIIITLLIILGSVVLGRVFFIRGGIVAGEQSQNLPLALDELTKKVGSNVDFSVDRRTDKVAFMAAKKGSIPLRMSKLTAVNPTMVARQFMQEYGQYFGISYSNKNIAVLGKREDELGMQHVAFSQKYKGVPIFGAEAIVHMNKDMAVSSASATTVPQTNLNAKPKLSAQGAEEKAKLVWKDQFGAETPKTNGTNLYVFNKGLVENAKDDVNYLVWLVNLASDSLGKREYYFIDARTGDLVYQMSGTKDIYRRIYDGNSGSYTLIRSEGQGASGITDADNAYDILAGVHNYYAVKFGRNGANNQGGLGDGSASPSADTDAYVRIDNEPNNAFECPRAYFDFYSMKFCTGEIGTDIIGHEYTHGVIYHSIFNSYGQPWGLDYSGESGAVEEAYASIFGEAIEGAVKGSTDWQLGEDTNVPGYQSVSFSLSNPGIIDVGYGPYPGKISDPGFYCGTEDNSGVHQNSSVLAHASYLMAVGGSYNNYSISGIGQDAEERIFYRALTYYLTTSSNFAATYNALNTACNDLYGAGSGTCVEAQKALDAVELNEISPCNGGSVARIVSDTQSLAYSRSKSAKRRINLTVKGLSVTNKKWLTVRIGGKKMKVMGASASGDSVVVNVLLNYKKWRVGSYGAVVSYKKKVGHSWEKGAVSEEGVLSII